MRYSKEEIELLAEKLISENYSYADAYPLHKWSAMGLPYDQELFDILNIYISYLKKLKSYLP